MTPSDLIDDLRSRINPAYAATLGTESYERRLCAEALEDLMAESDRLREALVAQEKLHTNMRLEMPKLKEIERAARNLANQKGRHNTEIAYTRLVEALGHNV